MRQRRNLAGEVLDTLRALAGSRPQVAVAFSGGLDSTVLAHLLVARRRQLASLRLIHVDHGLQTVSADFRRHCARVAAAWKVPIVELRTTVRVARGESVEAAARDARYALLARELGAGEILVTAQHQDDQAETLLLQLFRGAGVAGLAAMPASARFAGGYIARPLLPVSRAELERHARAHSLEWVEDPTNRSERFERNFLRRRVMPLLRERWPAVDASIARASRHIAEATCLLRERAQADLFAIMDGKGLNVAALRRLPAARRRNAVRAFLSTAGVDAPSTAQLGEITGPLLAARADSRPEVCWAGHALARRAGRLELRVKPEVETPGISEKANKSWSWKRKRELDINTSRISLIDDPEGLLDLDRLPTVLELRPRAGGESLRPAPRARTQRLKKLLQAAKLTAAQRERLPLLFAPDGRLIAAGDRWLDASVQANVKSRRRARLVFSETSDAVASASDQRARR